MFGRFCKRGRTTGGFALMAMSNPEIMLVFDGFYFMFIEANVKFDFLNEISICIARLRNIKL